MNGTWKVTGGGSGTAAAAGAGAAAVAAVAWVIVTLIWFIVITVAVLIIAFVICGWLMRRRYAAYSPSLAQQGAAVRAVMQAAEARPATVINYHGGTHMHLEAGAATDAVKWPLLPLRDAVTDIKED